MHHHGKQQASLGNSGPKEEIEVIGLPTPLWMLTSKLDKKGAETHQYKHSKQEQNEF
jgi:hypothetical protein